MLTEPIKRLLIFHPHKKIEMTPNWNYNDFNVKTEDGETIHGWTIFPKKSNGKFILFSHGNAGNISHRIYFSNIFVMQGYTFIMYDYRGYGKSTGSPTEEGLFKDIEAVWKYMTKTLKINSENIIIFGNSLGTSVSSHLVSKLQKQNIKYKCTILQSPFYSLKHLTSDLMPSILGVVSIFVKEFNTFQYLENNNKPILLIHSKGDELIPFKHSNQLLNNLKCNGKCYFDIFYIKGGHNDPVLDYSYINKINMFVSLC